MIVALTLAGAPAASAAACPADQAAQQGGTTTLALGKRLKRILRRAHVRITSIAPATGKTSATLPVGGGCLVPATGAGSLALGGGLQLKARHGQARLTALTLDTARKVLDGRTKGRSLTLANLSGGTVGRAGFNTTLTGLKVKFTSVGARTLMRVLPVTGLHKGSLLGTLTSRPAATQALVKSGTGRLVLSTPTAGAFLAQTITPATVAPATLDFSTLTVTFPIIGGRFAVRGLVGSLSLAGGLKLTRGARSVTASGLIFSTAPPIATAQFNTLDGQTLGFANLNLSAIGTPTLTPMSIAISGVQVALSQAGAVAINGSLGSTLPAGLNLGTASFTAIPR